MPLAIPTGCIHEHKSSQTNVDSKRFQHSGTDDDDEETDVYFGSGGLELSSCQSLETFKFLIIPKSDAPPLVFQSSFCGHYCRPVRAAGGRLNFRGMVGYFFSTQAWLIGLGYFIGIVIPKTLA